MTPQMLSEALPHLKLANGSCFNDIQILAYAFSHLIHALVLIQTSPNFELAIGLCRGFIWVHRVGNNVAPAVRMLSTVFKDLMNILKPSYVYAGSGLWDIALDNQEVYGYQIVNECPLPDTPKVLYVNKHKRHDITTPMFSDRLGKPECYKQMVYAIGKSNCALWG